MVNKLIKPPCVLWYKTKLHHQTFPIIQNKNQIYLISIKDNIPKKTIFLFIHYITTFFSHICAIQNLTVTDPLHNPFLFKSILCNPFYTIYLYDIIYFQYITNKNYVKDEEEKQNYLL